MTSNKNVKFDAIIEENGRKMLWGNVKLIELFDFFQEWIFL